MDLACKGQYQDALIIHLIYFFFLYPYHIYSLTYDGIIDKNQIQYWNINYRQWRLAISTMNCWATLILLKAIKKQKIVNYAEL